MSTRLIAGSSLALFCMTVSALGQAVAIVRPPFDGKAKMLAFLDPKAHRAPTGIPGYYDPSTRRFTPMSLAATGQAGSTNYIGKAQINLTYHFDTDLVPPASGTTKYPHFTVFLAQIPLLNIYLQRPLLAKLPYLTDDSSTNTDSDDLPPDVTRDYDVPIPAGSTGLVQPAVRAYATSNNNVTHETEILLPIQTIANGMLLWNADVEF